MEQHLRIKDSVALGAGVVLIGDASTYINNSAPVLTKNANSVGYQSEITIDTEKTVREIKRVGSSVTSDIFTNTESLTVSCTFMEQTASNLLYALGGDGTTGVTGDITGSFSITPSEAWLRLELYFNYTDKNYRKIYVIPKVKVVSPFSDILVQIEKGIENKIKYQAVSALDRSPRDAVWKDYPLGRIVIEAI